MEVKLRETENAWKPARLRGNQVGEDKTADLYKKVRCILNKLTPQNFHKLVKQVQALPIDSSERLHGVIDLVFEKAIAEPMYSEVYAQMCKVLSNMQVADCSKEGQPENFRKLLLSRCQHEFEKKSQTNIKRDECLEEIEQCTDPEKKKELQLEFEEMERRLQMESVGNIRFVGELFKLGMLTTNIMHRCIRQLLKRRDEESLECLCVLLTTIGKDIESKKHDLSKYFEEMKVLSKQRGQISSRVRFMLQDVIELRDNKWVLQRHTSVPKSLDMIRLEAMCEWPFEDGSTSRSGVRGHVERGGDWRKCGGHRRDDEESLRKYCYLDSSKLRIKVSDLINVSLHKSDQFAAWTSGEGGSSDSDHSSAVPQTSDTFANLQDDVKKKSDVDAFSRPYGKQPPPSNTEREKAVEILRNFVYRDTRENLPHLSVDQVSKKVQFILEEFVNNNNLLESAMSVWETFPPSNMGSFVTEAINISLERSEPVRSSVGKLMGFLMRDDILTMEQFLEGFKEIAEVAEYLAKDVPKAWLYLAEILAPMLSTEALSFSDIKTATTVPVLSTEALFFSDLTTAGTGMHMLLVEVLRLLMKEKGPCWIRQRWDVAGISWEDFALAHLTDSIVKNNEKEKEEEKGENGKQEREEEAEGEKYEELELIAVPNKVNAKLPAVAFEEKKGDEIVEDIPPESVLTVPRLIYREDQWSPFNPDGKKKYERDFLMKLRDMPEAKKKPEIRPDVLRFVLKDKVNRVFCAHYSGRSGTSAAWRRIHS